MSNRIVQLPPVEMGALDQVMPSIWEDIKWLDERMD